MAGRSFYYFCPHFFNNLFAWGKLFTYSNGAQEDVDAGDDGALDNNNHCCAFTAWDKSIAIAACHSGTKTVPGTTSRPFKMQYGRTIAPKLHQHLQT